METGRLVEEAKKVSVVSHGFTLADMYRRMANVMGKPLKPSDSFDENLVAQLRLVLDSQYLVWEKEDPEYSDNFLAPLINEQRDTGRITLTVKMLKIDAWDRGLGPLQGLVRWPRVVLAQHLTLALMRLI